MKIIIGVLSIYVFFKTLYYGIYEFKQKNNKISGITIITTAIVCLILPNILVHLRIDLSN